MGQRDFLCISLLGKRLFQRLELITQLVRQLVAELLEILADARAVFAPAPGVERQQTVTPQPSRLMSSGFGS